MKNIAVYCGAATGNDEIYTLGAQKLGQWIVENNYGLTYGGGRFGLMGVVANSVLERDGFVHGIITQELADRELSHNTLSKLDIVPNMSQRKQDMLNDSVANIALPGGPGTLEEISEAFSWTIVGDSTNPCIFYNINHYYDELASFFDSMTAKGFMEPRTRQTLLFSDSLPEIGEFIKTYTPPMLRNYDK
ncbi:TIGR00730 family Rossman fold protein [Companilactobacillus nantensis]|uniref:Cytokinin riboside 5'-monophosphate phosphoribohydrolase n=1 Tax=Companilactobacillus nantensis DSM 16982 TaxID=1423774 RepID=A0A0R1WKL7_9LACO|nr:TIGR00730 family Rossman fold protein [Companilactobacillus nantensis]KRM18522.1 Rossmann fold nucleotide-binding protein [Companilactobacillus nantensis DSM 16982]GEO63293.1 cytokinin riboside 5'-monophosphate phosphoribohydrolase [Companilactobacillus nantensis]